jgi:hypothetical protein
MTILALEQMERIRSEALSEIARVTSGWTIFFEPFDDFNASGWNRLLRMGKDYFAGRVTDLGDYGLVPEFVVDDYPQKTYQHTCSVLCRKNAGQEGRPARLQAERQTVQSH